MSVDGKARSCMSLVASRSHSISLLANSRYSSYFSWRSCTHTQTGAHARHVTSTSSHNECARASCHVYEFTQQVRTRVTSLSWVHKTAVNTHHVIRMNSQYIEDSCTGAKAKTGFEMASKGMHFRLQRDDCAERLWLYCRCFQIKARYIEQVSGVKIWQEKCGLSSVRSLIR